MVLDVVMPSLWRLTVVLSLAALIGAGNAALNPNRPSWAEDVLQEGEIRLATVLNNRGAVLWLDARSGADFAAAHISNALSLNEDDWNELLPEVLNAWSPGQMVVVYCSSQKCHASHGVAERLRREAGVGNVFVLKGGWEAWQAAQN